MVKTLQIYLLLAGIDWGSDDIEPKSKGKSTDSCRIYSLICTLFYFLNIRFAVLDNF